MMKKICMLTISLCIAASVLAAPQTAFAAKQDKIADYPEILSENLEFERLSDYAVGENSYAFAEGNTLTVLENEIAETYEAKSEVSAIHFFEGVYYYSEKDGTVYSLPECKEADFEMPDFSKDIIVGDYQYFYNTKSGVLTMTDRGASFPEELTVELRDYSRIKQYGNNLYVMGGNKLYTLSGKDASEVSLIYSNFQSLTKISAAGAYSQLNGFSTDLWLVALTEGSNMTEFNLDRLEKDSEYYPVTSPRQNTRTDLKGQALLLCETGENTGVVAIDTKTYIMNRSGYAKIIKLEATPIENATATINAPEWAYSLPFMTSSSRIFQLSPADDFEVLALVTADSTNKLAHDFYLIEKITEDGRAVQGYVAKEFLNLEYPDVNEGGANVLPDPNESHDDYIRTVVLVLVVIVLALIAAGYITWVSSSGKKIPAKPKREVKDDMEIDDSKK